MIPSADILAARVWDVVIVGAGPAGSVSAALLAQRHRHVLLLDRAPWPREKACGGCLNAAAVQLLRQHSLDAALADALPLDRFDLNVSGRKLRIHLPQGAAIARHRLDARLVSLAQNRGALFSPATHARLLPANPREPFRRLLLNRPQATEIRARLVLACDGLKGTLLQTEPRAHWQTAPHSRLGFAATLPDSSLVPDRSIAMFVGNHGYVGAVRQPGGRIHLGASLDPAACRQARGPRPLIRDILRQCGTDAPTLESEPILGTRPLTGQRTTIASHRVLAVGDACGYIEPFTGEGIAWAIRGAAALACLLPQNLDSWPTGLAAAWTDLHHCEVVRRQQWCRTLRTVIDRPHLTAAITRIAQCAPWLPTMIAHRLSEGGLDPSIPNPRSAA